MRSYSSILIVVAFCALCAQPVLAQELNQEAKSDTVVTLELQSQYNAEVEGEVYRLPSAIMQRLTDQQPLEKLNVKSSNGRTHLVAHFRFADMEAFNQWYRSDQTKELIQKLNAKGGAGSMQLALDLMRR